MKHLAIAICDDDVTFLSQLEEQLDCYFSKSEKYKASIAKYTNTFDLYENAGFDILFMDIVFGKKQEGIEITERLREAGVQSYIVLMSSLSSFSVIKRGVDSRIFSYILKPSTDKELFRILDNIMDDIQANERFEEKIPLKCNIGNIAFYPSDVYYLCTNVRKTEIHFFNKCISSSINLKEVIELFPSQYFIRCHKAFIVNLKKIEIIKSEDIFLTNGETIPLGRTYKKELINNFLEKTKSR